MDSEYPKNPNPNNLISYYTKIQSEIRKYPFDLEYPIEKKDGTIIKDWDEAMDYIITASVASDLADLYAKTNKVRKLMASSGASSPYKFITLAYPPTLTPAAFLLRIEETLHRVRWKWFTHRIERMEFHSKQGYNPHLHIFVYMPLQPPKNSRIIKQLATATGLASNFIDIKEYRYHDHLNYIRGIKQDSKHSFMEKDEQTRLTLDIPQFREFQPS